MWSSRVLLSKKLLKKKKKKYQIIIFHTHTQHKKWAPQRTLGAPSTSTTLSGMYLYCCHLSINTWFCLPHLDRWIWNWSSFAFLFLEVASFSLASPSYFSQIKRNLWLHSAFPIPTFSSYLRWISLLSRISIASDITYPSYFLLFNALFKLYPRPITSYVNWNLQRKSRCDFCVYFSHRP